MEQWDHRDARVAFAKVRSWGEVWVAAGGPTGPASARPSAARAFEDAAHRAGARVLWFAVEDPDEIGADRPAIVIGAEPVWRTSRWPDIVAQRASVRAQIRRAENKGVTVERWNSEEPPAGVLRPVLDDWLSTRGLPAMAFMASPFVLDHPGDRQFWVARRGTEVVGYVVLVPGEEAFVEWIIQARTAPNGAAALLLDHAVRALPQDSAFTLGLVPLSTMAPPSDATPGPLVRALLAWTRAHATRFYNFSGLERFKAKFDPDYWRPLHLVTDGRPVSILTFHAVAAAFASPLGPTGFVARALWDAVEDEAQRLGQRLR